MENIKTLDQAKEMAHKIVENSKENIQQQEETLRDILQEVSNFNPQAEGFEEIAVLLSMDEEQFAILSEAFLEELEKSYNNVNDQLMFAQAMNIAGVRLEDIQAEFQALCDAIDTEVTALSAQKRAFLKRLLGLSYNAMSQVEGISKRTIGVPIEFCRENAKMPTYAHASDAGMDVYATEDITINPGETKLIPLGIKVALPLGYELQVRPRSGRSLNSKLRIANAPGTIDAGYRGEICVIADNIDPVIRSADIDENGRLYNILWGSAITISKGEKIAQLVLSEVPKAAFYETEGIETIGEDRGGGFGSTDKNNG